MIRFGLILTVAVLWLPSCADVPGTGSVEGWLVLDECGPDTALSLRCPADVSDAQCSAFDLETDFYALELFDERSGKLRLQNGGAKQKIDQQVIATRRIVASIKPSIDGAPTHLHTSKIKVGRSTRYSTRVVVR